MPEEHLAVKLPESIGEKSARKEQELADEQEEDRGILPKTLRNVLLITGSLLVISAAVYFIILRAPGTREKTPKETIAPAPTVKEGEVPVAVREGLIGRILGEQETNDVFATVEMQNDTLETYRPVGVIPHPYLQKRGKSGFHAVATREFVAGTTIYRITATVPNIAENLSYRAYLGSEVETTRELGVFVHAGKGVYTLTTTEDGFIAEPFIFITGPTPKKPAETITLLSGTFEIL